MQTMHHFSIFKERRSLPANLKGTNFSVDARPLKLLLPMAATGLSPIWVYFRISPS
jgi:hypothetical protein